MTDQAIERVAAYFKALSDRTRLLILFALRERAHSVGELAQRAQCSQANISKHLALLLDAGIVARTTRGQAAWLNVADHAVFGICNRVCESLAFALEKDVVLQLEIDKARSPRRD